MFSRSSQEDPSLYTLIDQEGDIYLYECRYSLPLGFMVSGDFPLPSGFPVEQTSALDELLGELGTPDGYAGAVWK